MTAPEEHFTFLWEGAAGPPLEPEFRFHPERKWRADFAVPSARLLIEIEGGVHSGGRHTRGTGFAGDAEKYLEATLLGYTVIRLIPAQLNLPTIERIASWTTKQPPPPSTTSTPCSPAPAGINGSSPSSKRSKRNSKRPT